MRGGPDGGAYPRFTWKSLAEEYRSVAMWAFVLPSCVIFGIEYALDEDETAGRRLLSAAVAVTAALLIASYVLRYFPKALHHDGWSMSRSRRLAQGVLLWAWVVFWVVAVTWWLFLLVTPW